MRRSISRPFGLAVSIFSISSGELSALFAETRCFKKNVARASGGNCFRLAESPRQRRPPATEERTHALSACGHRHELSGEERRSGEVYVPDPAWRWYLSTAASCSARVLEK